MLFLLLFWAGAIALATHNGAYITEIFRGLYPICRSGKWKLLASLGMPYPLAMRRIVLPQAFRQSIPPLGNQFIIGLKDSSLRCICRIVRIMGSGLSIAAGNFQQLDTYIIVGLYYLKSWFSYSLTLLTFWKNDYNEKKLTPSNSIQRTKGSL
ncbi:ABC transporter permease subunit [Bacillus pacificus]